MFPLVCLRFFSDVHVFFSARFVPQANLNDSHNQMVVHWAGEKSNVIVALARDSAGATGPRTSSVITPEHIHFEGKVKTSMLMAPVYSCHILTLLILSQSQS